MDCCFDYVGFIKRDDGSSSRDSLVRVELKPEFSQGLEGIEEFSHLILIYHLHLSRGYEITRRRGEKVIGVFSTRSQNRPNPLGVSVVSLVKREKNTLYVRGVNAFDGTPVLDVKPYDTWDAVNPKVPEWHNGGK
ncbi:tRNA (N6-threonylcarbamoyladenosine(37)-N6)-methyltransferase TrmO [Sulfuracidifex tepidarius]|uniref:S-adenosyl-L-methionine-binding protein n=1 Tax=Sulfuracidifex tepidarius TaxID=1294262 RepID=A0A510E5M0_9CREN|nr:tRNA (N6-threonylcarbamoyladenosine(37)-N6)-methyltransferase TrmO [Sulfuracidifex tepidarius]BBG25051.1 S-adenosyl-L-methionine-binding protein [Sulfuracidifex tepidarius]BBG27833.1 S-adenosyl-L-methionine-binding protein [Sulfuracidifex tepidarius]